jgi:hypothetical protein
MGPQESRTVSISTETFADLDKLVPLHGQEGRTGLA